jgi:sodium/hydrogen antiporter
VNELDLVLATIGGLVLAIGLLSRWLRQTIISENIIALAVGVALGPLAFGLLEIDRWGQREVILEHAARIALAVALMDIALRLPKRDFIRQATSYAVLLGILMPLMWITTSALAALIVGLPLWVALLVGATLTPTDPVVASSIVTGPVAEKNLPERLRHRLSAESGANDGLAYPFVVLPMLALDHSLRDALSTWIVHTILIEVGLAVLFGCAVGLVSARLLIWAEKKGAIERESLLVYALALSLTVLGAATLLGTDGILAVFAAGIVFHASVTRHEDVETEEVQGAVDRLLTLPIFALFGLALPVQDWLELGWRGPTLVVAVLLLRRLPWALLLHNQLQPPRSWKDAMLLGWFGPIGIAALYYISFSSGRTGLEEVWVIGSLVILSSIIVHGVTAAPLTKLYGRTTGQAERERVDEDSRESA